MLSQFNKSRNFDTSPKYETLHEPKIPVMCQERSQSIDSEDSLNQTFIEKLEEESARKCLQMNQISSY